MNFSYAFLLLLASERNVSLALPNIETSRKMIVRQKRTLLGTMNTAEVGLAKFNQHL
jgi:hypothetical protein